MKQTVEPGGIGIQANGDININGVVADRLIKPFERQPSCWTLAALLYTAQKTNVRVGDEQWMTASTRVGRYGFFHRFKMAWRVFTGQYDAVKWPGKQ